MNKELQIRVASLDSLRTGILPELIPIILDEVCRFLFAFD